MSSGRRIKKINEAVGNLATTTPQDGSGDLNPRERRRRRREAQEMTSTVPWLNTVGLILTAVGVIGLFFFGIPFRVRTEGATYLRREQDDPNAVRMEGIYSAISWFSLVAILIGTAFQVYANWV
ncbi:hypothetical protein NKH14_22550 [Mesorhizobium sp. M1380]|uniref:hypothetical protein n=1 Tax=Mesorhizobium sp. M1380 TaxID=2957093 RepID=UPI0033383AA4